MAANLIGNNRASETQNIASNNLEQRVSNELKNRLEGVKPQMDAVINSAVKSADGYGARVFGASWSAAEKSNVVDGLANSVVEQFGSDLDPQRKGIVKQLIIGQLKYAMKAAEDQRKAEAATVRIHQDEGSSRGQGNSMLQAGALKTGNAAAITKGAVSASELAKMLGGKQGVQSPVEQVLPQALSTQQRTAIPTKQAAGSKFSLDDLKKEISNGLKQPEPAAAIEKIKQALKQPFRDELTPRSSKIAVPMASLLELKPTESPGAQEALRAQARNYIPGLLVTQQGSFASYVRERATSKR